MTLNYYAYCVGNPVMFYDYTGNWPNLRKLIGGIASAGTKILTKDGYKNIENIKKGDMVLAKNLITDTVNYREVLRTFIKKSYNLVVLKINGKIIETTTDHPFWVKGKGWIKAGELSESDILETSEGMALPIDSIKILYLNEPIIVYNFEVAVDHNYYVGKDSILVHNNNACNRRDSKIGNKISKKDLTNNYSIIEDKPKMLKDLNGNYQKIAKSFGYEKFNINDWRKMIKSYIVNGERVEYHYVENIKDHIIISEKIFKLNNGVRKYLKILP